MSINYKDPVLGTQIVATEVIDGEHYPKHFIENGRDENAGATADAAVVTDAAGTLSGKLRGIVKMLADVWDTASHSIKVKLTNATVTLEAGDIQIGGVEIKDATSAMRAVVGANGLHVEVRDGATKDAGAGWVSIWGVGGVPFRSTDQSGGAVSVTAPPTSGQKLVITDIFISVDTAMTVTLSEADGDVFQEYYLPANFTGQVFTPRGKRKLATPDKELQVTTSAAGKIMIDVGYYSEV